MSYRWLTDPDNRDLGVWLDRDSDTGQVMPTGITVNRISTLEIDDQMPDFIVKYAVDSSYYGPTQYEELLPLKESEDSQNIDCPCDHCERYW